MLTKIFISKEAGGYFIINGIEKVIRMLILPRRNFVSFLSHPYFSSVLNLFFEVSLEHNYIYVVYKFSFKGICRVC